MHLSKNGIHESRFICTSFELTELVTFYFIKPSLFNLIEQSASIEKY